ncbi:unnamed protein product [Mytilus edulis]|uniref:Uncharacterized protein n=1 Tax=Mytilus edulis TaxID=6550 RepID=A0A8S3PN09_MYTED|nr:unnamed protein product [Mytilus edulis]
MLYAGASSGIIVLLGIIGITKYLKKRILMSESRREKPTEEELHISEEPEMQEAFALHEGFYETIDDSHLDSISVPQTCNPNPGNDDESLDSVSSTNYIDDRSSYLDPSISGKDSESSISEISTNCNDDQSNYLQPLCSLISNNSSCHTEEHSHKVFPSANSSTCIADQTSCNANVDIEEDDSDDSSTEFSEDATHDRSNYLHPYNTLFNKAASCHIYEICQNTPSE